MLIALIAFVAGLALAFVNGANDNFKGVATLLGAGVSDYKKALSWATLATAAGALGSLSLSSGLLAAFSGKGLVPDPVAASPGFAPAAGLGAALTVGLATRLGFPVSTTHALMGALLGAGLVLSPGQIGWGKLGSGFVAPLVVSPIASLLVAVALYPLLHRARLSLGVESDTCVCVGKAEAQAQPAGGGAMPFSASPTLAVVPAGAPAVTVASEAVCIERYRGELLGVSAESLLGVGHFVSAGWVSFARGMNDTPKIAAALLGAQVLAGPGPNLGAAAVAMALGGWLGARRVAETMAHKITPMNAGQGLTANLVTGLFVLLASRYSLPVSTTHVACGALFGVGLSTGRADPKTARSIVASWVVTLPVAAACGAALSLLLAR